MPYLPEDVTDETVFPKGYNKDFLQQMRLVNEKWRRFYPLLPYECLLKETLPIGQAANEPAGVTPNTVFDPLWGEAVDDEVLPGAGEYLQPHLSGTADATVLGRFATSVEIHGQIRREAKERELKRLGFDEIRDILVVFPTTLLDIAGITIQQGDRFTWDNDRYQVLQFKRVGYWKNTNLRAYISCNCEHERRGS